MRSDENNKSTTGFRCSDYWDDDEIDFKDPQFIAEFRDLAMLGLEMPSWMNEADWAAICNSFDKDD